MGLRTRHPTAAPTTEEENDDVIGTLPNITVAPTSIAPVATEETEMPGKAVTEPPTAAPTTISTEAPTTAPTVPEPTERIDYVRFDVQLDDTTTDFFIVEVHPEWAPIGARRFLELVELGEPQIPAPFYNEQRFFRVLDNFIAQWGISGDPEVAQTWARRTIVDDPVIESNVAGTLTFATAGENFRTTQTFINYGDNTYLDAEGFAPFGKLYSDRDMEVAKQLYSGYGEGPPEGDGPDQLKYIAEGNEYLEARFPLLSYIISTQILEGPPPTERSQLDRRTFLPKGGFFKQVVSNRSSMIAASATFLLLSAFSLYFATKCWRRAGFLVSKEEYTMKIPLT